jgi:hypothetical protein
MKSSVFWDVSLCGPLKAILGFIGLNGVIFHKTELFTNTAVRTSNLHSLVIIIYPMLIFLEASMRQKGLKNIPILYIY